MKKKQKQHEQHEHRHFFAKQDGGTFTCACGAQRDKHGKPKKESHLRAV